MASDPMLVSDLRYDYPPELIAQVPQEPCRILLQALQQAPCEISQDQLFNLFQSDDLLILNDSKVIPRRVFTSDGHEILFLRALEATVWEVLFVARDLNLGQRLGLPGGVQAELQKKGLPQQLVVSHDLDEKYFLRWGQVALPPYIQRARGERRARPEDERWYQSAWAKHSGSTAAPTASLHFQQTDLEILRRRGVHIHFVTLHVGLGTFLPIQSSRLDEHPMHSESVFIPMETVDAIEQTKSKGRRVWALGTTAARSLEALACGHFVKNRTGEYCGDTNIFLRPGYEWKLVDGLLTNFHQPESTLLALVAAFVGLQTTLAAYRFAVEQRFRLFSYGDLSVWLRR
jgi:S-adenosylmethionine:tRNA ribosyltransferase-isomerase